MSAMAQPKTLTEAQIAVLRWISDGCPDGVMPNSHHRISAAALRSRGLVETRGRGATWAASITAAGRAYLAKVDGPEPPIPRRSHISVNDEVVGEIVASGGTLRIARVGYRDSAADDYVRRAHAAERRGKVPAGKLLIVRSDRDEVELRLVDTDVADQPADEELRPVPVPSAWVATTLRCVGSGSSAMITKSRASNYSARACCSRPSRQRLSDVAGRSSPPTAG
jgi:hypothetical protein